MIYLIERNELKARLKYYFQYKDFRPGQQEIISDVMQGLDVLGILPTGSGKSLCYQLPAKILPGTTIVVSPLISLMIDQVRYLRSINFKEVIALNSFIEFKHRKKIYRNLQTYKLIYISPELLQREELIYYLQKVKVSLFVIDEAHCISQWGHEFRPDYLRLKSTIQLFNNPPVLALSATATPDIQEDIIQSLDRHQMVKHIYPMDRPNIAFNIVKLKDDQEKLLKISHILTHYNVPTLIYFSSRKDTERVANYIASKINNRKVAFYHGGLEPLDRISIQQQFMNNQLDIICCTSAFGMGIDKEDIRLIVHYHFPPQLESFIQEVGRAGRDGMDSMSVLLYSSFDKALPIALVQQELPTNENLSYVFQQLKTLADENKQVPSNSQDIMDLFQVNETQWRYIKYQLEINGMMKDDLIYMNDQEHSKQVFNLISSHKKKRLLHKKSKLMEILNWINEQNCLRERLYSNFQDSYRKPTFQCCSNCDFSFENWLPAKKKEEKLTDESWENKLKKLFFRSSL